MWELARQFEKKACNLWENWHFLYFAHILKFCREKVEIEGEKCFSINRN